VKSERATIISEELNASPNYAASLWKIIRCETTGGPSNPKDIKLKAEGTTISDPVKVAETLNQHFVNIAKQVVGDTSKSELPSAGPTKNPKSFFLGPVCCHDINLLCKNLKNKMTAGVDEIPVSLLKQMGPILGKPLSHAINAAIEEGVFPKGLKRARIVPVFKKGDREDPNNYRPISVLYLPFRKFMKPP